MLKYNNNMTTISINIIEPYLSYILNGQKIIEGRLNKGKFKDLKIGDIAMITECLLEGVKNATK